MAETYKAADGTEYPMIAYYQGKRVDDMSREELIRAVKWLGTAYNRATQELIERPRHIYDRPPLPHNARTSPGPWSENG